MSEKLKNFFEQFGPIHDGRALTFPQLDTEIIKRKLRLKEEGEEKGQRNYPPKSLQALDEIEQGIVSFISNEVKDSLESFYDHQKSYEDRVTKLGSIGLTSQLESIPLTAASDFKKQLHQRKDELYLFRAKVTESEKDLEKFKAKNALDRSARFPKSRFLYYAVALLLLVIETFVNGMFFAKGDELGIVGGFFRALIPAALNVAGGFYLGNLAFRLFIHRHKALRACGVFLCLLIPSLIALLNLFVAHYRSAVANLVSENPAKAALETFLAAPFSLVDVESWLLFTVGCVFALIATIDFWKMDDVYLHYGEVSRDRDSKVGDYANLKSDALEELQDIREENLENLEGALSVLGARHNEATSIFDAQRRWQTLFTQHLNHLESVGRSLLAYYRGCNSSTRTEPAPEHFSQEWKLEQPEIPMPSVDFQTIISGFQAESQSAQKVYKECVKRIEAAYNAGLEAYKTIDELQPEEFEKWLTTTALKGEEENLVEAA